MYLSINIRVKGKDRAEEGASNSIDTRMNLFCPREYHPSCFTMKIKKKAVEREKLLNL